MPRGLKKRVETLDFKRPKRPAIECYKCGRIWQPDPRRWNFFNPTLTRNGLQRILPCPSCGARNQLSMRETIDLLKFYGMWEEVVGKVKGLGKQRKEKKHRLLRKQT